MSITMVPSTPEQVRQFCAIMEQSLLGALAAKTPLRLQVHSDAEPVSDDYGAYGAAPKDHVYMGATWTIQTGRVATTAITEDRLKEYSGQAKVTRHYGKKASAMLDIDLAAAERRRDFDMRHYGKSRGPFSMPPDKINDELRQNMSDHVDAMLVKRRDAIDMLAAAFVKATGLPPERCELVEQQHGDGKTTWHFMERQVPPLCPTCQRQLPVQESGQLRNQLAARGLLNADGTAKACVPALPQRHDKPKFVPINQWEGPKQDYKPGDRVTNAATVETLECVAPSKTASCPGCHLAIYDDAAKCGWCADCLKPGLRVQVKQGHANAGDCGVVKQVHQGIAGAVHAASVFVVWGNIVLGDINNAYWIGSDQLTTAPKSDQSDDDAPQPDFIKR
jgi:hypothetical protein